MFANIIYIPFNFQKIPQYIYSRKRKRKMLIYFLSTEQYLHVFENSISAMLDLKNYVGAYINKYTTVDSVFKV